MRWRCIRWKWDGQGTTSGTESPLLTFTRERPLQNEHEHHGHLAPQVAPGAPAAPSGAPRPAAHEGHGGHASAVADFRRRFWVSLALTVPVVLLSDVVQRLLGFELRFAGDRWVQLALASAVYVYGGWPFLTGLVDELGKKRPGMMTLVALAISGA